jgi:NADH-quinone oxidoreductase subunit N
VVVSIYYYFGVIRAIYWSPAAPESSPIRISLPARVSIFACIAGIFWLGLFPGSMVNWASEAVRFVQP